ncbi:MAG TPA: hypothetical protein VGI81_17555, partial [Tepidisphaeraceae bacterium]
RPQRHPLSLHARYPAIVEESLAMVGTNVDEMKDRGLFNEADQLTGDAPMVESLLLAEDAFAEEALLLGNGSRRSKAARRRRAAIPSSFKRSR